MQRILKLAQWACLMSVANIAVADETSQIIVSATVPPRPCQYPDRCDPVQQYVTTKVTVEDGVIRYVGPPPMVTQSDDLITILF